ncbi:MAG: flavin-containing monooxygenase [Hyphomicrobiaceae bacterium]
MMSDNQLLIIGAGPVGLSMANALKSHGIAYHQVDANKALGGNWLNGVYRGVHLNSSKKSTAYVDYPMPEHYADFPSAGEMLDYLIAYARDKGIADGIEYSIRVERAEPRPDDNWDVTLSNGERRIYKGIIVCNGHHWDKRLPELPGQFAGEIMHSKDYVDTNQLRDKRVLVIGAGNSACDIVCDAARVATKADVSMRQGHWFLPRAAFGRPLNDLPIWHLPVTVQRWILRAIVAITIGDYRNYGLEKPKNRIFDRHTSFGAEMLNLITLGCIEPRRAIAAVDGQTVRFVDGYRADYDLIVAATGFNFSFPFLPEGLIEVKNDVVQLYGYAFPTNVKNLYVIGASQPRGGFGYLLTPATDLYARVIKLQDEMQHPVGAVLEFMGEKIPKTHLVDPGGARREITLSRWLLPYLKWQARRLERRAAWDAKDAADAFSRPASQPVAAE